MCLAAKHLILVVPARLFCPLWVVSPCVPPPAATFLPVIPRAARLPYSAPGAGLIATAGRGHRPRLSRGAGGRAAPGGHGRAVASPPLPWRPPALRRTRCRGTARRWCRDTPAPRWASTSARGRSSAPGAASGSTSPRLRRYRRDGAAEGRAGGSCRGGASSWLRPLSLQGSGGGRAGYRRA